jgi:hypothetical protein
MGRPKFRPTREQRRTVMRTRSVGMTKSDIALIVGIDEATLRLHFERELRDGPRIMRQELMACVLEEAAKGKQAAIKLLAKMLDRDNRVPFSRARPCEGGEG